MTNKRILLHICCAPCSASAVRVLIDEYDISFFWYNPNIYDEQEYKNRKNSALEYAKELNIQFYEEKNFYYNYYDWKNKSREECNLCYALRLEKVVEFAKKNSFDFFSTSLFSSPYQKHYSIKQIASDFADKYMIRLFYRDFRTNFYKCKNSLKQKGYYMQKYCACNKSYIGGFANK